jgi:surfeit locus 1 family protein
MPAAAHIDTMHFRPLPILSGFAIVSLIILVMLGNWQWQRYEFKRALPQAAPVQVLDAISAVGTLAADADFVPARLSGSWAAGTISVYAVEDGVRGARWFSPLISEGRAILVDRGFAPEGTTVRDDAGATQLEGMLRRGARLNSYTPDNDAAANVWYWPDVPALLGALNAGGQIASTTHYLAVSQSDLAQTGKPRPNPFAQPGGANLIPAERHLGYAITWWGLGFALIGVYLAVHAQRGRLRLGAPKP